MNASARVISLTHLKTFAYLVDDLHFTRAAEALCVTQPAVTQHVQALERHFGTRLIDRDRFAGKLQLTPAGLFLAKRAISLIENIDAIDREMSEFSSVKIGRLRLGASLTVGGYGLTPLVRAFKQRFPEIELEIVVENTASLARRVLEGEMSIALVEGKVQDELLEEIPYQDDVLTLVVAPTHRFARRRKTVSAFELVDEPFIMREIGSGTRALFESAMAEKHIALNIALSLPSNEGILQAVEAQLGVAVISSLVSNLAVEQGRLNRLMLSDISLERSFRLIRRRHSTPSPAAQAFATLALDMGLAGR